MTVSAAPTPVSRSKPRPVAAWALWRDSRDRWSWLRVVTLMLLTVPVLIATYDGATVGFGPRPLNNVIHRTGYWALLLVLISLAITPLRRVGRLGLLLDVRRMIGVAAFLYAAAHVALYVADQRYDLVKVASEIAKRLYLTIGFVAVLGLGALAATSTDAMVRRLGGKNWSRLHQVTYGVALLALIHFFQQTKADIWVPTFVAGLTVWLMLYRLMIMWKKRRGEPPTWWLIALAIVAAAMTFAGEAIGIALAFNTTPWAVLQSALDFDWYTIRPGWFVLAAGLAVAMLDAMRAWLAPPRRTA